MSVWWLIAAVVLGVATGFVVGVVCLTIAQVKRKAEG